MSWNVYRKILNVLLQNLMREHFEISILKLISQKLTKKLIWNSVCFLFSKSRIWSIKIIKLWQLIWPFQNGDFASSISILNFLTFRDGDSASSFIWYDGSYRMRKETIFFFFVNCVISQIISHQKLKNMEFCGKNLIHNFLLNFADVKVIYFDS